MATEQQPTAHRDKPKFTCPACQMKTLVDHCESPHCTWHLCRNGACDLVADLGRGIGHKLPIVIDGYGKKARTRWRKAAS